MPRKSASVLRVLSMSLTALSNRSAAHGHLTELLHPGRQVGRVAAPVHRFRVPVEERVETLRRAVDAVAEAVVGHGAAHRVAQDHQEALDARVADSLDTFRVVEIVRRDLAHGVRRPRSEPAPLPPRTPLEVLVEEVQFLALSRHRHVRVRCEKLVEPCRGRVQITEPRNVGSGGTAAMSSF